VQSALKPQERSDAGILWILGPYLDNFIQRCRGSQTVNVYKEIAKEAHSTTECHSDSEGGCYLKSCAAQIPGFDRVARNATSPPCRILQNSSSSSNMTDHINDAPSEGNRCRLVRRN
jgi:hypothetical protein